MTTYSRTREFKGATFREVDLSGARVVESNLSGVVIRGSEVAGMEIDAPWLIYGDPLTVNGVDIVPLVEAELDRRFPGRELRKAEDPEGLQEAYAAVERTWEATLERVAAMPAGTVDASVDGEWSFAQTLRHLVMATDLWLGQAVLGKEKPFHPVGLVYEGAADEGFDMSVLSNTSPTYDEVLEARADRMAMVRDFLASVTPEELDTPRTNPWNPQAPETTRTCLHTVLEEEWEHHRFAVRDLDRLEAAEDH